MVLVSRLATQDLTQGDTQDYMYLIPGKDMCLKRDEE